jgi:predicted AlkP superfamily phosphohydrolase/phosphomutase/Flp pilus assembly protein TadD
MARRLWYSGSVSLLFVLTILFSAQCSKDKHTERSLAAGEPVRKLILLGVDGGDWTLIKPLVEQGKLPNFGRLIAGGATGILRSMEPTLSPLLWTSMATGKNPEEHGILSFTVRDPATGEKVPVTRLHRRVDAFWNFLSDADLTVDIVGWLATYPPEEIDGVMVTDKVGYLAFAGPSDTSATNPVFPDSRREEIEKLIVRGNSITYGEFKPFLHIDEAEFNANRDLPFDPANPVNNAIQLYASAKSFCDIGLHLLETDDPDVLAVYFEFVDAMGHLFMPYAPPRQEGIDEGDYEKFKDAVEEAYVFQDKIIGQFMEKMGENTVLMIVSDHGFKSGDARLRGRADVWAGKAAMWHRLDGIIGFYGDGVKSGYTMEKAEILDVTPTILALAGLPRALDMPGTVLAGAFEPRLASRFNPHEVATLGRERPPGPADEAVAGSMDKEALKKLEALGYISGESPDTHNNLGQRYQKQGEFEKAIVEFQKAIELNPNFTSAMNNLAVCYSKLKRFDEAEAVYRQAIKLNPHDAYAMNNLAVMLMESNKLDEALTFGTMAVKTEPNYANAYMTVGAIYANMGKLDLAEWNFKKVLQIEPDNEYARGNLKKLKVQEHQQ